MTVDDTAAQPPGGTTTTTCTRLLASFGRLHCQTDEPSPADVRVRLEIQSQGGDVFPSATITNGGPGIAADIQIQLTASAAVEVPFAHDPTWDCTEQDSSGTAVCVQRGVAWEPGAGFGFPLRLSAVGPAPGPVIDVTVAVTSSAPDPDETNNRVTTTMSAATADTSAPSWPPPTG
jgi:hypothetical protein